MAREKPPAFQFYPKDWLTDEGRCLMTPAERGWYLDLMCHEWLEESIPEDIAALAKMLDITPSRMAKIWEHIGPKFKKHRRKSGRLIHPRLERERKKQRKRRKKQQKDGKKGADIRWGKDKSTNDLDGQPKSTPMESDSSSSSSSSSSAINNLYTTDFKLAWSLYPDRQGDNPKKAAFKAWEARRKEGVKTCDLITATKAYAAFCFLTKKANTEFVMQAKTFFGPNERYKEYLNQADKEKERGKRIAEENKPLPEVSEEERAAQLEEIEKITDSLADRMKV